MSKKTFSLAEHSLFKKPLSISDKNDIVKDRIERFGEKIIVDIPLNQIEVRPQVRKSFDENKIHDLSIDISKKGLIHPVTVMKHKGKDNAFILLIGGNRYQAFKTLKKQTIPAMVKPFTDDVVQIQLIQLAENMHRTDINPIELSEALKEIKTKAKLTQEQLAKAVGRNIDSIKQYSRISKLEKKERDFHLKNKSSKNEILKYLSKVEKKQNDTKKGVINTKNKLSLLELVITKIGSNKDSNDEICNKIKAAKTFIEEAETYIKTK
jgi:ParB family transcriptional regulator, chromosome partitioning protein